MPKLSSGGPDQPNASSDQITRVDLSPEDIRKMSSDEIHDLLARLRANRQQPPSSTTRSKPASRQASKDSVVREASDFEEEE